VRKTLTIGRLGHQGDGIAKSADHEVFVPFSLPGEIVSGEIIQGRILAPLVVTPSPDRVQPPCPHFRACGGCALQHASDSYLAEWKIGVVKTAIAAQGLAGEIEGVSTSPPQSRRRATLAARRTKKGALVGFHSRATKTIIAIPACTLLHPDILAAVPAFEALTKLGASRKGEIAFSVTVSDAGLDVAVTDAKQADGPFLAQLGAFAGQAGFARLSWNSEVIATPRPPVQMFGEVGVVPPPAGFLQATKAGQTALTDAVKHALGPARKIADLFAGCGTFTLPLAKGAEVAAYESDADALAALEIASRGAGGLKPVRTEVRDLFRRPLLPAELDYFDAVVIDPPRAGAKAQTGFLAQSTVPVIAFVACNPATFARDARDLVAGGYHLDWVRVVDQFRWSPHVELVAKFSRGRAK